MNEANGFDVNLPGYRRASDRWPGAPALTRYYRLLTTCDYDDFGVIEYVKSFLECVCLTILGDFGEPIPANQPSLTQLFAAALKPLGMQNSRDGGSFSRLLSAFNRLADALSEVRNEHGAVAHGKDGFLDSLSRDESRAFLHTGDAILGFLLNALDGTAPNLATTREPYARFQHFNERIDQSVRLTADIDNESAPPVVVVSIGASGKDDSIELRIEPSRLLFAIDRDAFVEIVNATAGRDISTFEDDETPSLAATEVLESVQVALPRGSSRAVLTATYSGYLQPLRASLNRFLTGEGLDGTQNVEDVNLLASVLATAEENMTIDVWKSEGRKARLKLALRDLMAKFVPNMNARVIADRLVTWLRIQLSGVEGSGEPGGDEGAL